MGIISAFNHLPKKKQAPLMRPCKGKNHFQLTKRIVYLGRMMEIDLLALGRTAVMAAKKASAEILKIREQGFVVDSKKDNSPVTLADKNANQAIIQVLESTKIPLLSEESDEVPYAMRKRWDLYWLIDPLDGTKSFIRGENEFAVCIALMQHNEPILGVIALPSYDRLYFAHEKCSGILSHFSLHSLENWENDLEDFSTEKDRFTIVIGTHHNEKELGRYIDQKRSQLPHLRVEKHAASFKFCLMAEGKASLYPRFTPCMEWDTAAGHAILKAQGKNIYQMHSREPVLYNKNSLFNPPFEAY